MTKRLIAIGDIHGCTTALESLLAWIDVHCDDTLVTLGDYVDKGPDSRGTLERLIQLQTECNLVPILGNHDQMLVDAVEQRISLEEWRAVGGAPTIAAYGDEDLRGAVPAAHLEFLRSCLRFYETEAFLFVHACYDANQPLRQTDDETRMNHSLRRSMPLPARSGKRAVVGHTAQKNGEILDVGHLVCIDTSCWAGGWLSALNVADGRIWQVDRDGRRRS